jgi:uncharacterized protein (TIGR03067 family)
MKQILGILTLALFVPAALIAADTEDKGDAKKADGKANAFVGHYKFTAGEKDGQIIPEDRLKDSTVAINNDTIAVLDRDKKEVYTAIYKLTKEKDGKGEGGEGVWRIDMESRIPKEGSKAVGLIKRDGKQVWLIYDLTGKRPENFDKTAEHQHLFKLVRTSKEPTLEDSAAAGGSGG